MNKDNEVQPKVENHHEEVAVDELIDKFMNFFNDSEMSINLNY